MFKDDVRNVRPGFGQMAKFHADLRASWLCGDTTGVTILGSARPTCARCLWPLGQTQRGELVRTEKPRLPGAPYCPTSHLEEV